MQAWRKCQALWQPQWQQQQLLLQFLQDRNPTWVIEHQHLHQIAVVCMHLRTCTTSWMAETLAKSRSHASTEAHGMGFKARQHAVHVSVQAV